MKWYVGIDNGITGSVGLINSKFETFFYGIPTIIQQNYTKTKQNISRVNQIDLPEIFNSISFNDVVHVMLERPMINPARFKASISAARSLEAVLIFLENAHFGYVYIDSKEWQKKLLPSGIKGTAELKKASLDIGIRMFPQHEEIIKKNKDADGLLIAEYCRRFYKGD